LGHSALSGKNIREDDSGSGASRFICRRAIESSNQPPVPLKLAQFVQVLELRRMTPPQTPPRVAPKASAPDTRDTAGATSPHPSCPMPTRSDTNGDDASSPPNRAAGPAATAVMPEGADTETGVAEMQTTRSRTGGDSPAYTSRARYWPQVPTISQWQLQRELRSICTVCKRSQRVMANVAIGPNTCSYPSAFWSTAQPVWGWTWILLEFEN